MLWSIWIMGRQINRPEFVKNIQTGDIKDIKPYTNWPGVSSQAELNTIIKNIRDPKWLRVRKEQIKQKYIEFAGTQARKRMDKLLVRFEGYWRIVLQRGLREPYHFPDEIASKFCFMPKCALTKRYGHAVWTEKEKILGCIIHLEIRDLAQPLSVAEWEYDLDSYKEYSPIDKNEYLSIKKIDPLSEKADNKYNEYLEAEQFKCSIPTKHWRKRRMNLPLDILNDNGINIDDLRNNKYQDPYETVIEDTNLYDKLKQRQVNETDKLEIIKPRTLEEMQAAKGSKEVLGELRNGN